LATKKQKGGAARANRDIDLRAFILELPDGERGKSEIAERSRGGTAKGSYSTSEKKNSTDRPLERSCSRSKGRDRSGETQTCHDSWEAQGLRKKGWGLGTPPLFKLLTGKEKRLGRNGIV